jgi:hypothetical protein
MIMIYRTASDLRLTNLARAELRVDPNRLRGSVAFERRLARHFHNDT